MQDQFYLVEQEYFRLRGQFAVGRITEEEFDAALRRLAFQDEEGHFWMIGANSGRWYYSIGLDWYESEPVHVVTPRDELNVAPAELVRQSQREAEALKLENPNTMAVGQPEAPVSSARAALPFLLIALALLGVAALAFFLFNGVADLFAGTSPGPTPTRIAVLSVTPNPAEAGSTAAAESVGATATLVPTRTATSQAGSSPIPVTETPGLALVPTEEGPALTTIPTITPSSPGSASGQATEESEIEPEQSAPEYTGPLAPDVYVTGLRALPNPPPQRAPITFTVSFLNTNPQAVGMEWRLVFLDPSKSGRNRDWGQSHAEGINIPPGESEFSMVFTPVTGRGPCVTLYALVARRLPGNERYVLPGTSGTPLVSSYTFC
jgi:hypothetical protein